jgi:hydroxymethylpyrimidine/phosphomethylpyrimidine kinase
MPPSADESIEGRQSPADERAAVVAALEAAVRLIEASPEFCRLIPEVRVNFVNSLAAPATPADVAAVDGRITAVGGLPKASGPVRFGASDHMARLVIELSRRDPTIRSGLDFRWHERILPVVESYCRERGLALGVIDRTDEPRELIGRDGASIPWKVERLIAASGGSIPPVFYESRGWGKEPLFFTVGPEPAELAVRVVEIARRLAAS